MRVLEFSMLSWSCDHQLSVEEILASEVDEDPAFKELDEKGMTCSFAPLSAKASPEAHPSNS